MTTRWEYGRLSFGRRVDKDSWPHTWPVVGWWTGRDEEPEEIDTSVPTVATLNRLGKRGWELVDVEQTCIASPAGYVGGNTVHVIDAQEWISRTYWLKRRVDE
jgi:hypothetical protein